MARRCTATLVAAVLDIGPVAAALDAAERNQLTRELREAAATHLEPFKDDLNGHLDHLDAGGRYEVKAAIATINAGLANTVDDAGSLYRFATSALWGGDRTVDQWNHLGQLAGLDSHGAMTFASFADDWDHSGSELVTVAELASVRR